MVIALIVTGVLLIALIIWIIATSNRFKVLLIKISEADSGIDVALTKRYDTLTKMIEVVKAYAKHERELFSDIVKLRMGMSFAEKTAACESMNKLMEKINVAVEAYPELRSSENYLKLKEAITDAEDHLQAARRLYNANVSMYNQKIAVFPSSIIAYIQDHNPKYFFEAESAKRVDVKIDL
jgi:LemA protein